MKNIKSYEEINEGVSEFMDSLKTLFGGEGSPSAKTSSMSEEQTLKQIVEIAEIAAGQILATDPEFKVFRRFVKATYSQIRDYQVKDNSPIDRLSANITADIQDLMTISAIANCLTNPQRFGINKLTKEQARKKYSQIPGIMKDQKFEEIYDIKAMSEYARSKGF